MKKKTKKRNGLREIPEDLWTLIEPLLPPDKLPGANGRPRVPNRTVFNGILYVLRTGCQWKMVPREYGSGSTCHLHFLPWLLYGTLQKIAKQTHRCVCTTAFSDRHPCYFRTFTG